MATTTERRPTLADGHRYFLDVDPEGIVLKVECPWRANPTMVERACWPSAENGGPAAPPQPICTFESWVESLDWTEILHGSFRVELGLSPEWHNGEYLELHLRRVIHAWDTTPIEQDEIPPTTEQIIRSITHGPMSPL